MSRLCRITSAIVGLTAATVLLTSGLAHAEPEPPQPDEPTTEVAPTPDPKAEPMLKGEVEKAAEGAPTLNIEIPDQMSGRSYPITFERTYAGESPDGSEVYVYVPQGWADPVGKLGLDPRVDPDPNDDLVPCDYAAAPDPVTAPGMTSLGQVMADEVIAINEEFLGLIPPANPDDPNSDAVVIFLYEAIGGNYYDCAQNNISGQYESVLTDQSGMHAFMVDLTLIGGSDDLGYLGGLLAHELQHLQTHQVGPEESWIDEGLSMMIEFLGYGGRIESHVYAHEVRNLSLVNWEFQYRSYAASQTFLGYLWARAGGSEGSRELSDGRYQPDGGDLLIRLIHRNPKSGVAGIEDSIAQWNEQTGGDLPTSARELYLDMSLALALDVDGSRSLEMPEDVTSIVRNQLLEEGVGVHAGAWTEERWLNDPAVLPQAARQYQTNHEWFREPGDRFRLTAAVEGAEHTDPNGDGQVWVAQAEANQTVTLTGAVDEDLSGGTLRFVSRWHFFDADGAEGDNRGWVEAMVDGQWQAIPVTDVRTGDLLTDPQDGNVLDASSPPDPNDPKGDTYWFEAQAQVPDGSTAVRFRNQNKVSFVNLSWYLDSASIDGTPLTLTGDWQYAAEFPSKDLALQVASTCDLTPGEDSPGEWVDGGHHLYRWVGLAVASPEFTDCGHEFLVAVSAVSDRPTETDGIGYRFRIETLDASPSTSPSGTPTTEPTSTPTTRPTPTGSPTSSTAGTPTGSATPTTATQQPTGRPTPTIPAAAPGAGRDDLANTGSPASPMVIALALLAVAAGLTVLALGRRRG